MDKSFCADSARNKFMRTENSSLLVHFDIRSVFVNLRTHVPEKLLELNSETRTVQATNNYKNLKVYLYFSEPVLNSSTEVLSSLNTSQGVLLPNGGRSLGNRRFGFLVENVSSVAIVTISFDSSAIISRQGTPVSPIAPVTFLYDSQRPIVRLSTTSNMRTREHTIPILIKFLKPVFGFNSSHISISGGQLQSFNAISRSIYTAEIKADHDVVSVNVPENITGDVAGNQNLASNILQVRHYSVPITSCVISTFTTASFVATSLAAGWLTVSTASLQSVGAFLRPRSYLVSDPARNLFRIASHIQVFALSRWLPVTLPVEYYEFARGIQWSIPYFSLPWETGHIHPIMVGSSSPTLSHLYASRIHDSGFFETVQPEEDNLDRAASVYGLPLTPMEYRTFFENHNFKPEAEYISDPQNSNGRRDFNRSMFWLAVIGGSLILLHALLVLVLKIRKKSSEKQGSYGALVFPRFEIFLIILVLPCICEASASLVKGGTTSAVVVGILLFGVVAFVLLALFLFLSVGISFGKLLLYKEVHREGQQFHWYQDIVRVTLGPGKRGQWTWKNQSNSVYLTMFGPLFEDLRGPPKYMLSQIAGGNSRKPSDHIIASDDETEDAEAPFIQRVFGILRIYYTLLESMKRVTLGIVAGAYSEQWYSKAPIIFLLCITSFQLFFLVLKKPFIKKKVQLVEIISVSTEVAIFASCLVLLEMEFPAGAEKKIAIFMLLLFLVGYVAQMINEWYALYRQAKRLDPAESSFLSGLKTALIGFLLFFIPLKIIEKLGWFPVNQPGDGETGDATSSADRSKSSGSGTVRTSDRPWLKQLRELAKASFSKEGSGVPTDPSTSQSRWSAVATDPSSTHTRWSGFWGAKRGGSSSVSSSHDLKSKPRELYKDLETIFTPK
ncbi:uncharacterized protein LOC100257111 isoform X2 [Vitis vinifera]|nr:uncharacterized protein LOC100257111 isoform X2 [Vitis vinifera]XP_010663150.1 uncharacterized protein LOC100257111 isoform X2 [Vitis vinifera]|eukprot:XP_010663149.1 PREDICTED: uncharacterized protein LOC100257111 isoform X2 [Vitis vinifera]